MTNRPFDLNILLQDNDADQEELDRLTRQLLSEIGELDIEKAELARGGDLPEGLGCVSVKHARRKRDNFQLRFPGKRRYQSVGHAIGKPLVAATIRERFEGQHGEPGGALRSKRGF